MCGSHRLLAHRISRSSSSRLRVRSNSSSPDKTWSSHIDMTTPGCQRDEKFPRQRVCRLNPALRTMVPVGTTCCLLCRVALHTQPPVLGTHVGCLSWLLASSTPTATHKPRTPRGRVQRPQVGAAPPNDRTEQPGW